MRILRHGELDPSSGGEAHRVRVQVSEDLSPLDSMVGSELWVFDFVNSKKYPFKQKRVTRASNIYARLCLNAQQRQRHSSSLALVNLL